MGKLSDDEAIDVHYTQPFVDLPYTPKNWYLSVFKTFPNRYPRGFYNIAIRPLLNIKDAIQLENTTRRPMISQPMILYPIDGTTIIHNRFNLSITCSEFNVTSGGIDSLSYAEFRVGNISKTSNTTSCTFSPDELVSLADGEYEIKVKYVGHELAPSRWSAVVKVHLKSGLIVMPFITKPLANQEVITNIGKISLESSPFEAMYATDIHVKTEWKICSDANGSNVISRKESTEKLTSIRFDYNPSFKEGNTYYVFVKYYGALFGESEWSSPLPFISKYEKVAPPTITSPPNNSRLINKFNDLIITTSAFTISDPEVLHDKTYYKICNEADKIVYEKEVDATTNYTINLYNLNLDDGTYYVYVKYQDNQTYWTEFSEPCVITLVTPIITPPILLPNTQQLVLNSAITISSSEFTVSEGTDIHNATDWILCSSNNIKSVIIADLSSSDLRNHTFITPYDFVTNKEYFIFARYKGERFGVSDWSSPATVVFTRGHIETPEIKVPCAIQYSDTNEKTLTVISSNFTVSDNDTDTHDKSTFKICSDISGNNAVITYTENSNSLAHVFTNNDLAVLTSGNYYVFIQHHGQELGWSGWSNPVTITIR